MQNALKKTPIINFPPPANIGGTDPVPFETAVPTLDPALAKSAKPYPVKPTVKKSP